MQEIGLSLSKIFRRRVLKMITPVWKEKMDMGIWKMFEPSTTDENKLIRLAFHDCIPYEDGTGGQSRQNKAL